MDAASSIPGKLDALKQRVGALEQGFVDMGLRLQETTDAVDHNTAITVKIEENTSKLAEHTGRLLEMAQTYADVKTTAQVVQKGVSWAKPVVTIGAWVTAAAATVWHFFF